MKTLIKYTLRLMFVSLSGLLDNEAIAQKQKMESNEIQIQTSGKVYVSLQYAGEIVSDKNLRYRRKIKKSKNSDKNFSFSKYGFRKKGPHPH